MQSSSELWSGTENWRWKVEGGWEGGKAGRWITKVVEGRRTKGKRGNCFRGSGWGGRSTYRTPPRATPLHRQLSYFSVLCDGANELFYFEWDGLFSDFCYRNIWYNIYDIVIYFIRIYFADYCIFLWKNWMRYVRSYH